MSEKTERTKRRRALEAGLAIAGGALLAHLCRYLPEPWDVPCRIIARVTMMFFGG